MGGTTAKACLIRDGALPLTDGLEVARSRRFTKSSGFPVAIPAVSMIEIGAGGGSIARINALGIVQVGPESAGAAPGPACYGLGGTRPTVSDADLVLGYLDADHFAGGTMRLHRSAAENAIRSEIAEQLRLGTAAAAWTIHDVVNETMAAAVRMHVSERGGDPSRLVVVAFGGAGPVHVCNLARKLRIRRILVPLRAGVLSALGLVLAPAAYDIARTRKTPLQGLDFRALAGDVAGNARRSRPSCRRSRTSRRASRSRLGSATSAELSCAGERRCRESPRSPPRSFWRLCGRVSDKYGYYYDDVPVELVTVHVTGVAGRDPRPARARDAREASLGCRRAGAMPTRRGQPRCPSQFTGAID